MTEELVIDSNVLFGAFISGKDVYKLLFAGRRIYLPDFAFLEIEKYKARILGKTKLQEAELQEFVLELLSHVTVIPALVLSRDSLEQAYRLCKDIDEKDTVYVAAAIDLAIDLVTSDGVLCKGLRERGFTQVRLLRDVVESIVGTSH